VDQTGLGSSSENDRCVRPSSHPSDQRKPILTLPLGRSRHKTVCHKNHCASNGARFICGCFKLRVKPGDGARLLDVESFARCRIGGAIDQENAAYPIAQRERVRTRGPDITRAQH
jgi:hypothetical protein